MNNLSWNYLSNFLGSLQTKLSVYISYLLRHQPEAIGLAMDNHGWVSGAELIEKINAAGRYRITESILADIVRTDNKSRFRFSEDRTKIKACQGHSISWVEPELTYGQPPEYLYHGTTEESWQKIRESGHINKMGRHAVHMQAVEAKAWQSAKRWHKTPVVLRSMLWQCKLIGLCLVCRIMASGVQRPCQQSILWKCFRQRRDNGNGTD